MENQCDLNSAKIGDSLTDGTDVFPIVAIDENCITMTGSSFSGGNIQHRIAKATGTEDGMPPGRARKWVIAEEGVFQTHNIYNLDAAKPGDSLTDGQAVLPVIRTTKTTVVVQVKRWDGEARERSIHKTSRKTMGEASSNWSNSWMIATPAMIEQVGLKMRIEQAQEALKKLTVTPENLKAIEELLQTKEQEPPACAWK